MDAATPTNVRIDWKQYDADIRELAGKIRAAALDLSCICPIPRGGYIVGVHLSHLLRIPLVSSPFGVTLVVDDVSDTGTTLSAWHGKEKIHTATLYWKEDTATLPDFAVRSYKKSQWIVYPWEI